MTIQPTTKDAYDLLHQGALVLTRASRKGIPIDVPYLKHQVRRLERQKKQAEEAFRASTVGQAWVKRYGEAMNPDSDPQLGKVLFGDLGYSPTAYTGKKDKDGNDRPSVTRAALEATNAPGLGDLIKYRKLDKTLGTYVLGLLKEQVDGVLHPFFMLGAGRGDGNSGGAQTFRSSSASPNFQNIPVRDPDQGRTVREAFYPWPGQRILEADYSGAEVRVGACVHQDPSMISYLMGKGDMHRDAGDDLFGITPDDPFWKTKNGKDVRFYCKNGWTFPQFYGSYWGQCAPNLWRAIEQNDLKGPEEKPLQEWLKDRLKIRSYKAFESRTKKAESILWDERFKVYSKWKNKTCDFLIQHGYVELVTGFRCWGPMDRKQASNFPIQGPAFHCLLWSLIHIDELARKEEWKTAIIGQIHDSDVNSLEPTEADHVIATITRISTKTILDAWKWLIIPMEIEMEAGAVDGSWHGKSLVVSHSCTQKHHWARKDGKELECLTCNERSPT